MSVRSALSPSSMETCEWRPSFDAVLITRAARPGRLAAARLVTFPAVALLACMFPWFGAPSSEWLLLIVPPLCLSVFWLLRARRSHTERVVIENGVMRISHFVDNRLVEQRRMKLLHFTLELREDTEGDCSLIALRTGDKTGARCRRISVARRLTPPERARFLDALLCVLRKSGANLVIDRICAPPAQAVEADAISDRSHGSMRSKSTLAANGVRSFPQERPIDAAEDLVRLQINWDPR